MPFAIYRHRKHKISRTITASSRHMTRELNTPNADPARADRNMILIGGTDPAADVAALVPAINAVGADGKKRRRSNSVISLEILLTASPEWWAEASAEQQQEWLNRSTAWLIKEYGRENIAHLRLHDDESTPHLTGFIVPIDPETGRLNARRWVGGSKRCSQQQTDYAAAVQPLGLMRGIEGSTAKHQRVKQHYGQLSKPISKLSISQPPRFLIDPEKWVMEQNEKLEEQAGPVYARARTAETDRIARKNAKATATKSKKRADRIQIDLDRQKELASRMRALLLPDVLDALGFEPDPHEKIRWKADGFNITVGTGAKASKWYDHAAGRGKGGAIDLVAHVLNTDFKGALAWLADQFGKNATIADLTEQQHTVVISAVESAIKERPPFQPPTPEPSNWQTVRKYLIQDRALPANYIDEMHEFGDVYADKRTNAVFICRDLETAEITGAELKGALPRPDGSRFTGMALGSRKDRGGFRLGDIIKATTLYLVESAIDAISLFKLRRDTGERNYAVISTAGTTPEPRTWFAKLADTARRICAFDNDKAGDHAAQKLRRHKFKRLKPVLQDWNEDLRAEIARVRSQTGSGEILYEQNPETLPSP